MNTADDGRLSARQTRGDERRTAIVAIAQRMFDEHGYGGTTMSAVALALGGSKSTLWAYFASKEELFAAAVDQFVSEFAPAIALDDAVPMKPMLLRYATEFLNMALSPPIFALNRLVISEASRFPELGRLFYARGVQPYECAVANYFAVKIATGCMRVTDPLLASSQFHQLCQAGLFSRALWNVDPTEKRNSAAIREDAKSAVGLFLGGYASDGAGQPSQRLPA